MPTGLERIAAKAREETKLRFTSLAHHLTPELIWESICHIPDDSAPGCDGQTVAEAKEGFKLWVDEMLRATHHMVTRNCKGNFKVGRKTEKSRLRRTLAYLRELMREIRHDSVKDQVTTLNQVLRGHYLLRCRR